MKYVAEDGKIFDTETECREHEIGLKSASVKTYYQFFDISGNPINDYDDSEYLYIYSNVEDVISYFRNEMGWEIAGIKTAGIYKFDTHEYVWTNIDNELGYLRHSLQVLADIKGRIMEYRRIMEYVKSGDEV